MYYDEVIYFIELIDQLVDSDFQLTKTLEVAKKSSKYHSSPKLFELVVNICKDEIDAFDEIHKRISERRHLIQESIRERLTLQAQNEESVVEHGYDQDEQSNKHKYSGSQKGHSFNGLSSGESDMEDSLNLNQNQFDSQ